MSRHRAAGCDPGTFGAPDNLLLDHHPNHHICAGVQFARLEARIAFEELLSLTRDISLFTDEIEFGPNMNLSCPARLELALTPAASTSGK